MKKLLLILLCLPMIGLASFPINTFVEECDNIILKDGEEISAKVLEITLDVIKYKKCNNSEGPLFSIDKSDVMMIRYSDGTKDIIKDNKSKAEKNRFDLFGLLALPFAVAGFFWGAIFFAPAAIILAIIGISQKDRKKILSFIGLVIGSIALILWIIFMSLYY